MSQTPLDLNQVTLPALDLRESIDFYTRLGLVPIVHSPETGYARFELPGGTATLSLHVVESRVREPSAHVYFETAQPDVAVERLRAQGLEPSEPLEEKPWLWREAWYVDPAGNRICVYAAGENRKNPPWRLER